MTEHRSIESPNLSDLPARLRTDRYLANILGVMGPRVPRGKQVADGFVRLVERTLAEYNHGRSALFAFMEPTHELHQYFSAQDHFENCVQLLHRAISYLDRLRRMGLQIDGAGPFV